MEGIRNIMKRIGIYILFILCALFAGCEREELPGGRDAREIRLFAHIGTHLSAQQTKGIVTNNTNQELNVGVVRLDEKTGESKTEGYPYFINCSPTPLEATFGTPNAEDGYLREVTSFSEAQFFKNSKDSVTYAAWYPWPKGWSAENKQGYDYSSGENGTTIKFPIPVAGDVDIMYSNPVSGTMYEGFDVMEFKHALSLFKVYVYSSSDPAKMDWGNVTSLKITGLPDECTITLPKDNNNREHLISYSKSKDGGITLTTDDINIYIPTGFDNKSFVKEWIAAPGKLPASDIPALDITVTTADGAESNNGEHQLTIARNYEPGYLYHIVLRFTDEGTINADVQIEDWVDTGHEIMNEVQTSSTFYNLSANGTSNCYIVSSANFSYCFDATIKGNGSTAAMAGSRINPYFDTEPKTVKIEWSQVPEQYFHLETEKIVEGKVLFKVNGNSNDITDKSLPAQAEGNVLLGVYDENGKCLWTWHIWITDKPQKQNYTKGYIALDRNLGATAPAPTGNASTMNGLFYQWGRPTPFKLITDNGNTTVDATVEDARVVPDTAVANPDKFYNLDVEASGMTVSDWVDRENFQYVNNLWGYREQEHEKPIKTIYDPCPHGYHVPYARTWEGLENYWTNKPNGWAVGNENNSWPPANGIELKIEDSYIWYPFQGYIKKDGTYSPGHVHLHKDQNGNVTDIEYEDNVPIVEVWSSLINRHDNDDMPGIDEKLNDSPYRFLFTKDYGAMLSDEYSNRSRGLAVRCVSNNTADVVKDLSASQSANCYMVHEDGYYKFKATLRGNGVGSLLPLGGTTSAEINGGLSTSIKPDHVDILWWQGDFTTGTTDFPTDNNAQSRTAPPQNMCLSLLDNGEICDNGFVSFQISGFKKGNVILAAYSDENKTQILWTWHIWLTDKPADIRSGNYTKMDRFLGATFAPALVQNTNDKTIGWGTNENLALQATLGFYYQWGRKDPIIGPPGINSGSSNENSSATEVASSGWWKKETDGWKYYTTIPVKNKAAIPEVVKDPTAFYRSTTTKGANTSQWFPESFADGYTNVALWGYAVKNYSIAGQTFSKTMHDPCPPGYRTPFHFSWRYDGSHKYAEGDGGEARTNLDTENDYGNYGIVTDDLPYFEKMWFPFCGYRDPLTGAYKGVGTEGNMNTGMPMGQYNTRTFWYNSSQTGQNANSGTSANAHGSAYGMMVRCMKE